MAVLIRDPDLQALLNGADFRRQILWFQRCLSAAIPERFRADIFPFLAVPRQAICQAELNQAVDNLYHAVPANLAERLHEAVNVYRLMGQMALPFVLPLALRFLEAELLLYNLLDKKSETYREHLSHSTRVAAMAFLLFSENMLNSVAADEKKHQAIRLNHIIERWSKTTEYCFLHNYLTLQGFPLPDQGQWPQIIRTAAILAGLFHDMGYIQAALGRVAVNVTKTFRSLYFLPQVNDGHITLPPRAPVEEMYRHLLKETGHGQRYEPLSIFLRDHFQSLHSVVGALWLAGIPGTMAREFVPLVEKDDGDCSANACAARGAVEMIIQLAAMMAFAHDFAQSDAGRREKLGLQVKTVTGADGQPTEGDVLNFEDYPVCTLFALADVLQEFGRPLRVLVGHKDIRYYNPVVGVRFSTTAEAAIWEKTDLQHLFWGLPAKPPSSSASGRDDPLFLTLVTRPRVGSGVDPLCPLEMLADVYSHCRSFKEDKIANKISAWLSRALLADKIVLDGDPAAPKTLREKYQLTGNGEASPKLKSSLRNLLTARHTSQVFSQSDLRHGFSISKRLLSKPTDKKPDDLFTKVGPLRDHDPAEAIPSLARHILY